MRCRVGQAPAGLQYAPHQPVGYSPLSTSEPCMRAKPPPPNAIDADLPRRAFLQRAGAGLLGASLLPLAAADARQTMVKDPARIGVQLYTVRDAIKADLPGTLRRIAAMGFEGVETAFWPEGVTLATAARALREVGLPVSSCHVELPIGDKRQVMLDTAAAFSCTRMIWHGWPEDSRYSTLDGTKALAAIYNESNRFAKANGLQFGIHNHWWEYRNRVGERFVYEVLLEEMEPDIFMEVDTYWVKVAGHAPSEIVRSLGPRAPMLHIKDGPAVFRDNLALDNPDPMTAVGRGTQDFPAIVRAANGNTEWMIVEMDKTATDVFGALQDSYDYLIRNKLARGRIAAR